MTPTLLDSKIERFDVAAANVAVSVNAVSPAPRDAIDVDVVIDNHGPSSARAIRLSAPLPDGITSMIDADTPADIDCAAQSGRIVCAASELGAGESRALRLRLIATDDVAIVSGTVSISAAQRDPRMEDNRDSISVSIAADNSPTGNPPIFSVCQK